MSDIKINEITVSWDVGVLANIANRLWDLREQLLRFDMPVLPYSAIELLQTLKIQQDQYGSTTCSGVLHIVESDPRNSRNFEDVLSVVEHLRRCFGQEPEQRTFPVRLRPAEDEDGAAGAV